MLENPHHLRDYAYPLLDESEVFSYNIYTKRVSFHSIPPCPICHSVGSMCITVSVPLNLLILLGHFTALCFFLQT